MNIDNYLQDAFNTVCSEAKQAEGFYVCLMEQTSYYGGPEEGGWWGHDSVLQAYQWFATRKQAEAAKEQVKKLAAELQEESRKAFGESCLREMAWLDERGLDADYLPEPDGPSEYYVCVSEGLPENSYGPRQYS